MLTTSGSDGAVVHLCVGFFCVITNGRACYFRTKNVPIRHYLLSFHSVSGTLLGTG